MKIASVKHISGCEDLARCKGVGVCGYIGTLVKWKPYQAGFLISFRSTAVFLDALFIRVLIGNGR